MTHLIKINVHPSAGQLRLFGLLLTAALTIIVVMLLLGLLVFLGGTGVAPFIYTLF